MRKRSKTGSEDRGRGRLSDCFQGTSSATSHLRQIAGSFTAGSPAKLKCGDRPCSYRSLDGLLERSQGFVSTQSSSPSVDVALTVNFRDITGTSRARVHKIRPWPFLDRSMPHLRLPTASESKCDKLD
jgi:hypothetical protein